MYLTSRGVRIKRSTGFAVQLDLRSHSTAASCPSAAARCLHRQAVGDPLCPPPTLGMRHKIICVGRTSLDVMEARQEGREGARTHRGVRLS